MGIQMPGINGVPISLREQSTETKALQSRWEMGYIYVLVRLNALWHLMPFVTLVVERSWKIKGRVGQFSSVNMIFFSYHPVNYNSNVKDIYVWKSAKCFLLQCPLWQMRALLGSSADGGKTLEPNSNYSISKGHIHTHIHTQHTHTQPSTPIFTHLNTRNYTVTAQDLKTNKHMVLFRPQAQWLYFYGQFYL